MIYPGVLWWDRKLRIKNFIKEKIAGIYHNDCLNIFRNITVSENGIKI